MNTDKLKQMYASGGLLRAILKDPKMRQMASDMLSSDGKQYEEGGMMKYRMGGAMEYSEGGEMDENEPPKGTRRGGEFVHIQEPDLYAAYSSFAYPNQLGPMESGLGKLSEQQRESLLSRAATLAEDRFNLELAEAKDQEGFKTAAYQSGRYEPGSSFAPREFGHMLTSDPATREWERADLEALYNRVKLSPELSRKFGI